MSGDGAARRGVLEEVRRLVAADGADIELLSDPEESSRIELNLIIPSESCEECVLSRTMLEEMAGHMFREADPTVVGVRVHDPREGPSS